MLSHLAQCSYPGGPRTPVTRDGDIRLKVCDTNAVLASWGHPPISRDTGTTLVSRLVGISKRSARPSDAFAVLGSRHAESGSRSKWLPAGTGSRPTVVFLRCGRRGIELKHRHGRHTHITVAHRGDHRSKRSHPCFHFCSMTSHDFTTTTWCANQTPNCSSGRRCRINRLAV
jgi:hypothetical protein